MTRVSGGGGQLAAGMGGSSPSQKRALKTLLITDLVGSTALVERLGDDRAGDLFRLHDRLARDLFERHDGLEIDKSDGFLLLFERPMDAVLFAMAYHHGLRQLSSGEDVELTSRVGIHLGEVRLTENPPEDVARGAKPLEVEGMAKPFTARLMSAALGAQTLLSRAAFDLARRAAVGEEGTRDLQWLAHGRYTFKGVDEAVEIFEVGRQGVSPLTPPADSDKVRRLLSSSSKGDGSKGPTVQTSDLIGTKLGDFRIQRRLGAGGMGVVYEARDESLHRTVALKLLPAADTGDSGRREQFLREARSAAAVSHPNVATIYQVGVQAELVYIAMELVEGQTLRLRLADGPLPMDEALRIAIEIGRGIDKAHKMGVVHRDLKPDNVMLTQDGQVKLLDFGLAKRVKVAVTDETATEMGIEGRFAGTPGYMSPEQCRGAAVDARSDIFCFGVLLYEMLTGQRPFGGETVLDRLITTSRDAHRPASELRPEIPGVVDAVIDGCLAKAPDERPDDIQQAVEALRRLAGVPTPSTETGDLIIPADMLAPPRPGPWKKRRLWITALAVVLSLLGGVGLWLANRETASPLATKGSVLACPILEVSGAPEPSGWLGATAAHIACERATVMLGGETSRSLVPAELLDLPAQLTDDFPKDAFGEADARERSVTSARKRAAAWLDGKVTAKRVGFELTLRLMTANGEELARADSKERELYQAVRSALEALAKSGALPRAERVVEGVARWTSISNMDLALAVLDWKMSGQNGFGLKEEYEQLKAHRKALGLCWPRIQFDTAVWGGGPFEKIVMPPPDLSSAQGRMWTALARVHAQPMADRGALARELAALRRQVTWPRGQAELANAEALLWRMHTDNQRAGQAALSVAAVEPRWAAWSEIAGSLYRLPGFSRASRAYSVWMPYRSDSWNQLNHGQPDLPDSERAHLAQRAVILAPDLPLWSLEYTTALLRAKQPQRARSLAGRLSAGGAHQQIASQHILAKIDASEARFKAAATRARNALMKSPSFGMIETGDPWLQRVALMTAEILGTQQDLADAFARRFVLAEPHRLAPGHFGPAHVSETCARASKPLAAHCLARLRTLIREGFFIEGAFSTSDARIEGYDRFARGDMAGAAAAWRILVGAGSAPPHAAIAFDAAGEPEIASKLDSQELKQAPHYNGATLAHVREARRAAARGDVKRARSLANTVIDAWSVADTKVPAVAEMRALLKTLAAKQ